MFKETVVVDFAPPLEGFEKEFNTFRIGQAMLKKVAVGHGVFLMDTKRKVVFGTALVTKIETGPLNELCRDHASANHTEVNNPDKAGASDRLLNYITKLYGPHIAVPTKKSTVIYLKRIE